MLIDGRSLEAGTRLEADLCIIGAGPAGITIARALDGSPWRIVMLESGGRGAPEAAVRAATRGESIGHPYEKLELARARGVGGTSTHWPMTLPGDEGWLARPLDAIDLETRPDVPRSGWPFDRAAIESYYRRAIAAGRLASPAWDPAEWESDEVGHVLPLDPATARTVMFQRAPERFTADLPALEASPNIQLVTGATVVDLATTEAGDAISHVTARTRPDSTVTVGARLVVLATGGIDNPRLLLACRNRWPNGLGNANDLVGRFFMERLTARAAVLIPAEPHLYDRTGLYRSHVTGDARVHAAVSLNEDVIRREGLQNAAFWIQRRSQAATSEGVRSLLVLARSTRRRPLPSRARRHALNVLRDGPDVGRTVLEHLPGGHRGRTLFGLGVQSEQRPNPDSRVTLSDRIDGFGLPLARLDWQPLDEDRHSIRRSAELLDGAFRAAHIGHLEGLIGDEDPPAIFNGSFHHMGTTRMHRDPRHGVVDADSRVHDLGNLYVAGSSVFPTVGFVNPTLTIVALALRLSDHLASRLGEPIDTPSVVAPA